MSIPSSSPSHRGETAESAVRIANVSYAYGERQALHELSLEIAERELFAFLGPNGGGKSTLFRLLATLAPLQQGEIFILGRDVARETAAVRKLLGIVFQSPSLDRKLTVAENIRCHAAMYGLYGPALRKRQAEVLEWFGLTDRQGEMVERLSGGLRRRVELAKGMVCRPRVLLLDEPSTGLDPLARSELWKSLEFLRSEHGITVALTTHLLDEAEKADRIAILDRGRLVALDSPGVLRSQLGGDALVLETADPTRLAAAIAEKFSLSPRVLDGKVRLEIADGHHWIARLVEAFPGQATAITLSRPSLEDVFIARTGRRFDLETPDDSAAKH